MQEFFALIINILGSPTFGVVLSLLLLFQWYKQHAKEQAIKNALFAIRRKVYRGQSSGVSFSQNDRYLDLADDIDSILATLGARKPFRDAFERLSVGLCIREKIEEVQPLAALEKPQLLSIESSMAINGRGKRKTTVQRGTKSK